MSRATWLGLSGDELLAECEIDCYRASGPGGQKRNKTESAVRLRHLPSGVSARAAETRSQHQNRARALLRLQLALAIELREDSSALETAELQAVASAVKRARFDDLIQLAQLLDMLADAEMSLREVADRLELTSAGVARALKSSEPARRWVNQERAKLELGPLK